MTITAYIMDVDSTEWKLVTIDDEVVDTGDEDEWGIDIDEVAFFGTSAERNRRMNSASERQASKDTNDD